MINAWSAVSIRSVLPVVRHAILAKHTPKLQQLNVDRAVACLHDAWSEWHHVYRSAVAAIAQVAPATIDVATHERVRSRLDGKTPMIDLPRLRTTKLATSQFDLRNCLALCLDDFSSKVWTRIGLPETEEGCSPSDLSRATAEFRRQAVVTADWFYEHFFRLTRDAFGRTKRIRVGRLEVTTVALRVDPIYEDECLDRWLLDGDGPNLANEDLRRCVAAAADMSFDISELPRREPEAFWMSLPAAAELPNGALVSRRFLFLVRPVDDGIQVVGVGLDDSKSPDLGNEVALKMSRLIANRI
jgi:hypothetical protein